MSITAGKYIGRATGDVVLGASKNKGTPYIEFMFDVSGDANEGPATVRWTGYFTEKSSERTIEALQNCGWQGDNLSEFEDHGLHGLDANEVELVVEVEEWQGTDGSMRETPKVAWVNKLGGGSGVKVDNAMDKGASQAFGDKMRGLVLATKAKRGVTPTPGPTVAKPRAF